MKKSEIIRRMQDCIDELAFHIEKANKSLSNNDPQYIMDYQTVAEATEALKAFDAIYDNKTPFKDTFGNTICIGDTIDIIATNMYDGEVSLVNGEILLGTTFFDKKLSDHLEAIDIELVEVRKDNIGTSNEDDILPF